MLIEHSLTYGLISLFLNPIFPYPGNDLMIISFSFNILCALLIEIPLISSLFNLLIIHPYTIISTKSVIFYLSFHHRY